MWVRTVCNFGINDLAWLDGRTEMFVNKFNRDYHWLAYDCMEERLVNLTLKYSNVTEKFNLTYYSNLPFVRSEKYVISSWKQVQQDYNIVMQLNIFELLAMVYIKFRPFGCYIQRYLYVRGINDLLFIVVWIEKADALNDRPSFVCMDDLELISIDQRRQLLNVDHYVCHSLSEPDFTFECSILQTYLCSINSAKYGRSRKN